MNFLNTNISKQEEEEKYIEKIMGRLDRGKNFAIFLTLVAMGFSIMEIIEKNKFQGFLDERTASICIKIGFPLEKECQGFSSEVKQALEYGIIEQGISYQDIIGFTYPDIEKLIQGRKKFEISGKKYHFQKQAKSRKQFLSGI